MNTNPLPVGTVRQRKGGFFVKVGKHLWLLERSRGARKLTALVTAARHFAGRDPSAPGVAGLSAAIITNPESVSTERVKTFSAAIHDMFLRTRPKPNVVPVARAIKVIDGDGHGEWHEYAARRLATFNGGQVDMDIVPRYAAMAREFHKDVHPGMDAVIKGYIGPRTMAEISIAAWDAFLKEGGALNQPHWLETDRLHELRREFERLSNMFSSKS